MNRDPESPGNSPGGDIELVKAFQAGDRHAFDRLVLRHQDRLFNLCYGFFHDAQEAEDATQESFIKAYRALKGFRYESSFYTWLYRIALNTCKNKKKSTHYRQKQRAVRIDKHEGRIEGGHNPGRGDEGLSPAGELEKKQQAVLIREAVNNLPAKYRTMVLLRDMEGFSYEDIAKVTGLKQGTVKSRVSRARTKLKERLRGVIQDAVY